MRIDGVEMREGDRISVRTTPIIGWRLVWLVVRHPVRWRLMLAANRRAASQNGIYRWSPL